VFRQEKLTAKKLIACVLGFAGIVVVNLNGLTLTMNFLGDGFVIFSAVSYAFSSVLMKRFSKYEDPVVISGYQFIIGGAFMIILGFSLGGRFSLASFSGVVLLIYLAFLSAIAYALWGLLLKYNPVSRVSIFSFTTPIFGTILSVLLLPGTSGVEPLNIVITLVLVSLGIFLLNYQGKQKNKI
jgi:drug/metabolite transporter (DMT)-like permease